MITLLLRPSKLGDIGQRYDVFLDLERIVEDSLDPEYDAARVLKARGLTGSFQTTDDTGKVRMTFPSIEIAAQWAISENEKHGPRLVKYRSFADAGLIERFKSPGGNQVAGDDENAS